MEDPRRIEDRLANLLKAQVNDLRVLGEGWETTIFEFSLGSQSPIAAKLPSECPVVLRLYQGKQAAAKGVREHLTIDRLFGVGYCVPRPYLFEPDGGALGAPFLIMERLAGGPLLTVRSFPRAFKTFSLGFVSFVRAQVRLHRLDPLADGLAEIPHAHQANQVPAGTPLLDRVLSIIGERVESGPLPGLRKALARLRERATDFAPARPSLVHMDYHPLNVLVRGTKLSGVIDWVNADLGDRHLDAAMTAVILSSSAMEQPRWMRDNPVGNTLRTVFASLYVPLYHAMAPMDFGRFRYCQAVAALLRLSMLGMMRARGPETVGFRAEAISEVTPAVLRLLSRYVTRKSGTFVRPDLASPSPA